MVRSDFRVGRPDVVRIPYGPQVPWAGSFSSSSPLCGCLRACGQWRRHAGRSDHQTCPGRAAGSGQVRRASDKILADSLTNAARLAAADLSGVD